MKTDLELEALRRGTVNFIANDPEDVVITRIVKVDDDAGGWTRDTTMDLEPQRMRLGPASRNYNYRTTVAGEWIVPTHEIIAEHDADLEEGDTFELYGTWFRVIFVDKSTEYQTYAEATEGG